MTRRSVVLLVVAAVVFQNVGTATSSSLWRNARRDPVKPRPPTSQLLRALEDIRAELVRHHNDFQQEQQRVVVGPGNGETRTSCLLARCCCYAARKTIGVPRILEWEGLRSRRRRWGWGVGGDTPPHWGMVKNFRIYVENTIC